MKKGAKKVNPKTAQTKEKETKQSHANEQNSFGEVMARLVRVKPEGKI